MTIAVTTPTGHVGSHVADAERTGEGLAAEQPRSVPTTTSSSLVGRAATHLRPEL